LLEKEQKILKLQEEINELKEKNNDLKLKESLLKIKQAEFINQKEKDDKNREELIKYSQKKSFKKIIIFLDSFKQAISLSIKTQQINENENLKGFLEGFQINFKEFEKILTEQGVKKIQ